jgi:ABC-type glycerol-3-phosphate transport system substrate-binding protein
MHGRTFNHNPCRADLFQAYNLTVPQTWDDFLQVAKTMNGTVDTDGDGQNDLFGACFDVLPGNAWRLTLMYDRG